MEFKSDSNWNEKNEIKSFLIFKKLQELNFPRGMQMELCKNMAKESQLDAGNISAKVSNYKSVAGINRPSNASRATKEIYEKYKNYSSQELQRILKSDLHNF